MVDDLTFSRRVHWGLAHLGVVSSFIGLIEAAFLTGHPSGFLTALGASAAAVGFALRMIWRAERIARLIAELDAKRWL